MKILLTGAAGLVGRGVMAAGRDSHEFVAVDVSPQVEQLGGVQASVTDRDAILRIAEGCDTIVHTAALHGRQRNNTANQKFIEVNVIGAENLFEAALTHGIRRLVFSSTLEVLCGVDWAASGATVFDETSPPRPDWIYPLTKLQVEQMGHYYAREHGLEVVQLRYAYVRSKSLEQLGLGLLARSVANTDVAQANLLATTVPGLTDHVFLIGPDTPLDSDDIVAALDDPWRPLQRHWRGSRALLEAHGIEPRADQMWPIARIDAARQILGWRPRVTVDRYLRSLGWSPDHEPAARAGDRAS